MFRRYPRWVETGVFDASLETLADLAGRDRLADMIDSMVVRAHHCAAGIKKELDRPRRLAGFSTKLHVRCDACGMPLGFVLTPGQAHDIQGVGSLFRMIEDRARMLLADRSYDADAIRAEIIFTGTRTVIPAKRGRRSPALHS